MAEKKVTKVAVKEVTNMAVKEITNMGVKDVTNMGVKNVTNMGVKDVTNMGVKDNTNMGVKDVTNMGVKDVTNMGANMAEKELYQLKVALKYLKPPIWRRIEVPSDFSFEALHFAIQEIMRWQNFHEHMFKVGNVIIGKPLFSDKNESVTFIKDYLKVPKQKCFYDYDLGSTWYFVITLEKILPAKEKVKYPRCVTGRRKSPPETLREDWQDKVDPTFKFKPTDFFKNWDDSKYLRRDQVAQAEDKESESAEETSDSDMDFFGSSDSDMFFSESSDSDSECILM